MPSLMPCSRLKDGLPSPTAVNARHVQALRANLRAETLSHAAGLTSHSTILMYGKSGFLGLNEAGHGRSTVGLTRARGPTLLMGPPGRYGDGARSKCGVCGCPFGFKETQVA